MLTSCVGLAGDRNARAIRGTSRSAEALGGRTGHRPAVVGTRRHPIGGGWARQLEAARPDLRRLGIRIGEILDRGARPVSVMGRCSASLATLPEVARRHPQAAIVWFDAHGDCNVPAEGAGSETCYLGGMVLTGAAGLWETGLGADMDLSQVVLVGGRDLDPTGYARIERGEIRLVGCGPDLDARLRNAIRGRVVYVHLACDEYQVPGGMSLRDLSGACGILAEHEMLGLEITEFEGEWPGGEIDDGRSIVRAVEPLPRRIRPSLEPEGRGGSRGRCHGMALP